MSKPTANVLVAQKAYLESLQSLRRQLQYLETEARECKLEIAATLIGAALEELSERIATLGETDETNLQDIPASSFGSTLRH